MVKLRKQCRLFAKWFFVSWLVALLASCGGDEASPAPTPSAGPAVTVLDISLNDSYYGDQDTNSTDPPRWEVPVGGFMILNMENHGKLEHNWAIVKKGSTPPVPYKAGQGGDIILYGAGMVYSHNKTTITLVAPSEPGEYIVMCTVENHYPLMQGRLIVK